MKRFADDRVCIVQGPTWAAIADVRIEQDDIDSFIAEVRSLVPPENEPTWWIGPSTRPADLFDQLQARGFREPHDHVVTTHALALDKEPPEGPSDVQVTEVETFEQFRAGREIAWDAFDRREELRERNRARLEQDYEEAVRFGIPVDFLATSEGRPAGTATAIPTDLGVFLVGGATASWARGRGIYRALVRARWDYADARHTPLLVTQANASTSYPILLRLGFEEVCTIRRLEDPGPE